MLSKEQVMQLQQRWWTQAKERFGSLEEMLQEAAKLGASAPRDDNIINASDVSRAIKSFIPSRFKSTTYTQTDMDNATYESFKGGLSEAEDILRDLRVNSQNTDRREGYKRAIDAIHKRRSSL